MAIEGRKLATLSRFIFRSKRPIPRIITPAVVIISAGPAPMMIIFYSLSLEEYISCHADRRRFQKADSVFQTSHTFPTRSGPGLRVGLPGSQPDGVASPVARTCWKAFTWRIVSPI